jgi:pyruvate/2-oxoglutarate dehydrogenase complex dihydrolipoamide dehydrogenase (E3) component
VSGGRYDAVIIGSGPGGRGCASALNDAGLRVAMLESELVGGECPFWACIPSKTLLRPAEVVSEADRAAGLDRPRSRWSEISQYRDYMNSGLDDSAKFDRYSKQGIDIFRGRGRIVAQGAVEVAGQRLEAERIIVATGTESAVPEIAGLDRIDFWTNREGTSFHEVPASTVILGGGPVGLELGQMLSRYGSRVTIVETAERLLSREPGQVGEILADQLQSEGIDVRTGIGVQSVEGAPGHNPGHTQVRLTDGSVLACERLLVATGRRARVEDLGLDQVGAQYDQHGIRIDWRCRAAPGVWAVGDVTGVAPFTHIAAYQARIATADIQGHEVRADYRAVPRVVFTDPEVAAVGLTPAQAAEAEIDTREAVVDIAELDRTETYGRNLKGFVGLVADAQRDVLLGAWAVGPMAGEWIHAAVLAVKAEVPLAVVRDLIVQFPTFSEALVTAARQLAV